MSLLSIGDLASTFLIRRQSAALKTELTRLGTELSTGQKQDLSRALAGDYGPLAAIERSLTSVAAYTTATTEASGLFSAAQLALGAVQDQQQSLGPALLTAANARDVVLMRTTAGDARQKFASVVGKFNVRVADRTLFAGAATDRPALAPAETIMSELVTAVAAETTATGIVAVVDDWFDAPGGGFETLGYLGSDTDIGPLAIAEGETVDVSIRADDSVVRDTLKSFALGALIAEDVLSGNVEEQAALLSYAAGRMLTNDGAVTNMRARLGSLEARVEEARASHAAEKSAYDLARAELTGADPYETASALEAVYAQIETLYTVTARIAGLTFTDYMK